MIPEKTINQELWQGTIWNLEQKLDSVPMTKEQRLQIEDLIQDLTNLFEKVNN